MTAEDLQILVELVNEFHTRIKTEWTSLKDYATKGEQWIDHVNKTHGSADLTKSMKDILLQATFDFAREIGTVPETGEPYYALIMKGGGIKGLAYVGALEELESSGFYNFNWYAGTSAGAIAAILLSANHTTEELKTILSEKNFKDFKDAFIVKAIINLFTKSGLYEANSFLEWLNNLLAKKLKLPTAVRLIDLPKRTTIYASNRDTPALVYDSTIAETQTVNAAFAARCSMSIPFIFTPQKKEGLSVFDGGLQNNFPVNLLLEHNPNTDFLGLYLGDETFKWKKNNIFRDPFRIWMESSDPNTLRKYKDQIIVIDPSPISTLKFNLRQTEKEFLLEAGRLAALDFLDRKKLIDKSKFNFDQRKIDLDAQRKTLKTRKSRLKNLRVIVFSFLLVGIYHWRNMYEIAKNLFQFFSRFI